MSLRGLFTPPMTHPSRPPLTRASTASIATRRHTGTYRSLATGLLRDNMLKLPTFSSSITTVTATQNFLAELSLLPQHQDPNHLALSNLLLNITFAPGITALTADAIWSIKIVIKSLPQAPPPPPPAFSIDTAHQTMQSALVDRIHLLANCTNELSEKIQWLKKLSQCLHVLH